MSYELIAEKRYKQEISNAWDALRKLILKLSHNKLDINKEDLTPEDAMHIKQQLIDSSIRYKYQLKMVHKAGMARAVEILDDFIEADND